MFTAIRVRKHLMQTWNSKSGFDWPPCIRFFLNRIPFKIFLNFILQHLEAVLDILDQVFFHLVKLLQPLVFIIPLIYLQDLTLTSQHIKLQHTSIYNVKCFLKENVFHTLLLLPSMKNILGEFMSSCNQLFISCVLALKMIKFMIEIFYPFASKRS